MTDGRRNLDDAIRKADVLIEALEYIRRFRDRYVVIKLGGSALDDERSVRQVLTDVLFMSTVGMRPILVHGGGKAINRAMAVSGIEPRFVQGRRYTDDTTMQIVAETLCDLSDDLADRLNTMGGRAVAMTPAVGGREGREAVLVARRFQLDGEDGPIDMGRVGVVDDLLASPVVVSCRAGTIPVLPCCAIERDADGHPSGLLNVNGDTAAAAVARLLEAEKLVFLSDVAGLQRDRNDPATLISHLSTADVPKLIADGTIADGMLPKIEASVEAIEAGVRKVHMVDAKVPHGLLVEIFSKDGIGTEIAA